MVNNERTDFTTSSLKSVRLKQKTRDTLLHLPSPSLTYRLQAGFFHVASVSRVLPKFRSTFAVLIACAKHCNKIESVVSGLFELTMI